MAPLRDLGGRGGRPLRAALVLALVAWPVAAALAQAAGESVPRFAVTVTLSPAAAKKIQASGEQIRVWAYYYGEARKGVKADEMGQISLGTQEVDIRGAGVAGLGGLTLPAGKLRGIAGRPEMLINVYTSRKVFKENLLNCDIFQDNPVKAAAGVSIGCKLIGE
ncbi:MAG: hypothetical protein ACOYLQ_17820 [Hyphomicrobiaceae bacterium]